MPKRSAPLSENQVKSAKISEKAYKLFDGGGLYLLVTPDGRKRWRFKYRFEGKEKSLSFGVYPTTRLDDARISRNEAREILSMGIDASMILRQKKEQEKVKRLEVGRMPSVRVGANGNIEIRKGRSIINIERDEAAFIADLLNKIAG